MPPKRKRSGSISAAAKFNEAIKVSGKKVATASIKSTTGSRGKKQQQQNADFSDRACIDSFDRYKDSEDPDIIGPEGIERLVSDLGLSLDSPIVLVFAWKLNAATMGQFTKMEWLNGMRGLKVDSVEKLKAKLSELERLLVDQVQFKEFYKFIFGFARDRGQKSMSVETAVTMWSSLLEGNKYPHVKHFSQFLEEKKPLKVVNKDQWVSFYDFVTSVGTDLSEWDEMGAWPVLFDNYVEWWQDQVKKDIPTVNGKAV
ncbi:uncharacterized protein VTP21DRAFT_2753 [Calcarisporiella thermophila]|uniref:uncharacterized protein n=1 Tax=Calcarisporiella thermophila TaxID=911321 RepID=UPI003743BB1E